MATLISAIVTKSRLRLTETTAAYWTDDELAGICIDGVRDLWRRLNDLYKNYFVTIDETNVSLAASANQLAGVPADLFRVVSIEPRVLGESNPNPGLIFKPMDYNDPRFINARAQRTREPNNVVVFYDVWTQGPPVAAPVIRTAPKLSSAVLLTVVYNQTLGALTSASTNPIPGESDNALVAWTVAYARAKEREDRAPDPEWLAIYGTEKTNLTQQLTPRQIQEPTVVLGMFEGESDED